MRDATKNYKRLRSEILIWSLRHICGQRGKKRETVTDISFAKQKIITSEVFRNEKRLDINCHICGVLIRLPDFAWLVVANANLITQKPRIPLLMYIEESLVPLRLNWIVIIDEGVDGGRNKLMIVIITSPTKWTIYSNEKKKKNMLVFWNSALRPLLRNEWKWVPLRSTRDTVKHHHFRRISADLHGTRKCNSVAERGF